jgi:hypothetical protein
MKHLLLASIVATVAGCPSAPRAILTDHAQQETSYSYTAVATKSDAIGSRVAREQIVTRYATGDRTAYVLENTATDGLTVPFKPLDKATLVVRVSRVSDINGWGTEVNGEVHRFKELKLEFTKAQLPHAFTMLQQLETAPLDTMASVWPTTMEEIQTDKEVSLFERGFVVAVDAKLVTGNPFDAETMVTLYRTQKRSGYFAL